jgi:hypothetical protein
VSTPVALDRNRGALPLHRRLTALLAVGVARVLAILPPGTLGRVLGVVRTGAAEPTTDRARAARDDVVRVSALCAGEGCLPRSIATALLCRLHGTWPRWCVGVQTEPFRAHAWVEVGGQPVGEPFGPGRFAPILAVPPRRDRAA